MANILIIDDEYAIRDMLRAALEHQGHDVFDASDGDMGIALYREEPTDLVITDIFMPKRNGLAVIWELKRDFPDVEIIAISGGSTLIRKGASLSAAKQFDASRVFTKPFEISEVVKCVQELVSKSA